jgi:FtsH-binding integral membrane protein
MKVFGIILVVISVMAFLGWFISFSQGKSESEAPLFYVFLLLMFIGGLLLIDKSKKKEKEKTK